MSRCGKTDQLEAMVLGELNAARVEELQTHTPGCAVCHHELNWLKSERLMFEQRLAREQVQQLWQGFAARRSVPKRQRAWGRWAMGVAASAVLMIGIGLSSKVQIDGRLQASEVDELPMSLEEMSRSTGAPGRDCSELRPGMGFACGPYLPASFVAQRE
jgi:anti-sigma factor RsiW